VKEEVGSYQLDQDNKEDIDELRQGSILLVPYKSIRSLLLEEKIELI
jgi:hypothetical protein